MGSEGYESLSGWVSLSPSFPLISRRESWSCFFFSPFGREKQICYEDSICTFQPLLWTSTALLSLSGTSLRCEAFSSSVEWKSGAEARRFFA